MPRNPLWNMEKRRSQVAAVDGKKILYCKDNKWLAPPTTCPECHEELCQIGKWAGTKRFCNNPECKMFYPPAQMREDAWGRQDYERECAAWRRSGCHA